MKPCSTYRQEIVSHCLNLLDPAEQRGFRSHLETCAACRAYFEEMSALTSLQALRAPVEIETSERFHQRIVRALQNERRSPIDALFTLCQRLPRRVALSVGTVAVIALISLRVSHHRTPPKRPAVSASIAINRSILEPTVSNYQIVANASLDELDELLTKQGNRNLPGTPQLAGGSLRPANAWE